MTTIAYDGRYLAADTLGVRGGNRSEQPSCKIAVQDGYAFAFGGMWWHFRQQLMAWALAAFRDADPPEWRGFPAKDVEGAMLVVTPMRGLLVFTDQAPYPDPEAWPFAIGTGGDIALGAMGAGATAMEAVKLAMRWDLKTGGEVDFIDTEWLAAGGETGVQRWDGTISRHTHHAILDDPAKDIATPAKMCDWWTTDLTRRNGGETGVQRWDGTIPMPVNTPLTSGLQKGELARLRAVYAAVTRLPVGKHLITVEDESGQAALKPEGGMVIMDVKGKRITIVPDGLNMVRIRRNPFPQNV